MSPRLLALCLVLAPVLAPALGRAQPAPDEPPPPASAPAPPSTTAPTPPSTTAPTPPSTPPTATPPSLSCGPGQRLVEGACTEAPEQPGPRGFTSEISVGLGWLSPAINNSSLVHGIAGINVGLGGFVAPNVAMTIRMSGVTWMDNALVYFGVIGPNVQAWFGQGFIGGGIGVGFLAGCADSCDATSTSGFDLRAGYAFSPHGNISVEMESLHGFFSQDSLQLVSVLLGYQSF